MLEIAFACVVVLGLLWVVKQFVRYDPEKERQRTEAFLRGYYEDK